MIQFIKKQLAPNRLAVYLTALAALAVALVGVVGDLDFTSVVAALGSLAVLAGVVAKWLTGWQQYESAIYQQQIIAHQKDASLAVQQAAVDAQNAVGKPNRTQPRIAVPGQPPR